MDVAELRTDLHPLCYAHHIHMRPAQGLPNTVHFPGPTAVYACLEADCPIQYSRAIGYFTTPDGTQIEQGYSTPSVTCPHHGLPMYLAEVKPEKRSFRLWKCPQAECTATRTNEDFLVASA